MMKSDTQHLDYLISQYVDGCLDSAGKKTLEQRMINDPVARKLYKDHREVQDVLDEWGNRLPLIHWDEFDKQLAGRLEHEMVGGQRVWLFRRWARPMSVAASLFIAACLGYGWHAWQTPSANPTGGGSISTMQTPGTGFTINEQVAGTNPSRRSVIVDEPNGMKSMARNPVEVLISPDNASAAMSLSENVAYGLGTVHDIVPQPKKPGSVVADIPPVKNDKDEKEVVPAFP